MDNFLKDYSDRLTDEIQLLVDRIEKLEDQGLHSFQLKSELILKREELDRIKSMLDKPKP